MILIMMILGVDLLGNFDINMLYIQRGVTCTCRSLGLLAFYLSSICLLYLAWSWVAAILYSWANLLEMWGKYILLSISKVDPSIQPSPCVGTEVKKAPTTKAGCKGQPACYTTS